LRSIGWSSGSLQRLTKRAQPPKAAMRHFLSLRNDPSRSWDECATALEALRAAEAIGHQVARQEPDPASLPL
jgi:hypothetical protein